LDPSYEKISRRFLENPNQFADAFAKAWFKLTHRDMGPKTRYLGPEVPAEDLIWQDPIPKQSHKGISDANQAELKSKILASGLSISQLVSTAWASASTFRSSDKRGGANGARIRLAPQNNWQANNPFQLSTVLHKLDEVRTNSGIEISMADMIVLGGCAAIEHAAKNAGYSTKVPFSPGRTDATQDQTDVESFHVLQPIADGFRNYKSTMANSYTEHQLIDKAQLLTLTAPEMTVLLAGMRMLGANYDGSIHGVFTHKKDTLSTDFFVNLLDVNTKWSPIHDSKDLFEGRDRRSGELKWTATRVDLIFGSNTELRAIAEVYGCNDAGGKFVEDFASAWVKVMNLDRFDL
jgi:catalase-peroxidase